MRAYRRPRRPSGLRVVGLRGAAGLRVSLGRVAMRAWGRGCAAGAFGGAGTFELVVFWKAACTIWTCGAGIVVRPLRRLAGSGVG